MRVPCTTCGEPVTDDDIRCRMCGTLSPPLPGTSVFAAAVVPEPEDAVPWDEPTSAEPWAIPIRGPRVPEVVLSPERPDVFRTVTYAVVAVAVLAGVVVAAAGMLTGGSESGELTEAAPVADRDEVASDSAASSTTEATTPTTSTSTSTTTTEMPSPAAAADQPSEETGASSAAPAPTRSVAPTGSSSPVPVLAASFRSGWVAQLTSVPASADTESLEASFERVRADAPGAVATRSDDWPSLRPGYWVIVAPGPFGSEDEVRAFCARTGRSADGCLPRLLADRR